MKIRLTLFLLFIISAPMVFFGQVTTIGQWRTQLSYLQGIAITEGGGKVYCATQGGLFSYNLSDNSTGIMSKISGLSDLNVSTMNFDPSSNTLIIAYQDANIDIIQNGVITNLPDLMISSISGSKVINNIFFTSGFAYLACGFGIVVVDLTLHQTKDTYYIGPSGTAINVFDVNSDSTSLYAATSGGIYTAFLSSPNLDDFNNWTLQTSGGLPNGTNQIFNTMAWFNGKMYANNSLYLENPIANYQKDQVWEYNGTTWSPSATIGTVNPPYSSDDFKKLRVNNNQLVAVGDNYLHVYNVNEIQSSNTYFNYGFGIALYADALLDNNNTAWIADKNFGLVKFPLTGPVEKLSPNGPITNNVWNMACSNGTIWMVPGGHNGSWGNSNIKDGVSVYSNNTWTTIGGLQPGGNMNDKLGDDSLADIICIAIDTTNPQHAFAGSWHSGLLEFNNGALVHAYNQYNSPLKYQALAPNVCLVGGTAFDANNNLWVTNSNTISNSFLSMKTPGGIWQSFDFTSWIKSSSVSNPSGTIGNLIVLKQSQQKWVIAPRSNEIFVYGDYGTLATPGPTNSKVIKAGVGLGNLPGNIVNCIAEDKNGAVWIGTDQGIAVIYSPDNIFYGGSWDAQPIYVQQNGYTQLLFQATSVSAIAVDGANRKWCGTQGSGVFLMSADGTQQIYNFNISNSPLLSNTIISITINGASGEVFFGTDKGVISFKSTATDGASDFSEVYAYPNPVKHGYTGLIAIKGLVSDADVKITDITGTLIFKTTALGGQAIWDGNNFSGERAHTGVYLVFCSNIDGSKRFVTKILFIN